MLYELIKSRLATSFRSAKYYKFQGRHFRRQKVPNPGHLGGPYLHWRDLNLGMDVEIFGTRYRITNCDDFTRVI